MGWVLFIAAGGIGVPTAVFLTARTLVHRHGDPAAAEAYWAARNARHAEEVAALMRPRQATQPVPAQTRPRQKELTHR